MQESWQRLWNLIAEVLGKFKNRTEKYYLEQIKPKLNFKTVTIGLVTTFFILGGIGFFIGKTVSSKSYVLAQIEKGFKENNCKLILKNSKIQGMRLNKDNIKPLMKYYSNNSSVDSLIKDLKGKSKSNEVLLFREEKGVLFNKYYLDISPVYLKVRINYGASKILLDDKDYGTIMSDNEEKTCGPLVPGIYNVQAENKNKFDSLTYRKDLPIMTKQQEKEIEFNGIKISIDSEYKEAKVFVNGKDTNLDVSQFDKIGPFKNDGSSSLHIEEQLPWGLIKSEEMPIERSNNIHVNLSLKNEKLNQDIDSKVKEFFTSVFNALNNENENIISSNNKKKIYDEFKTEKFLLKNDYKLLNYNLEIEKSDIKRENSRFVGNVFLTLNYTVSKSLFGIDFSEDRVQTKFFLKMIYDSDQWNVDDMQILK